MDGEFSVSVGSKYRVNHGDEELTVGVFKGYSAIGSETAMVFQLDDGVIRFINLLEAAPKKPSKKKETGSVYYG